MLSPGNHPIGCFLAGVRWQHLARVPKTIRVALVNDYQIVLEGLRALLRPYDPEIKVVELDVEGNPHSAVDVTLFDTYGEVQELRQRVRGLAADATNGAIVVFSFSDDAALAETFLRVGAHGFISKALPAEQIVNGIRTAARGERVMLVQASPRAAMSAELQWPGRDARLTERESELLALLPTGMTNRELSEHFYVSENTIKSHLHRLFSKLDVRNRAQAAALARSILGESRARSTPTDARGDSPARPNDH
jgi:two-component system, NarL family, response regulator LiaR